MLSDQPKIFVFYSHYYSSALFAQPQKHLKKAILRLFRTFTDTLQRVFEYHTTIFLVATSGDNRYAIKGVESKCME